MKMVVLKLKEFFFLFVQDLVIKIKEVEHGVRQEQEDGVEVDLGHCHPHVV